MMNRLLSGLLLAAACVSVPLRAQGSPPDADIDEETRTAVVSSLAEELRQSYVIERTADEVASELIRREGSAGYSDANTALAFADRLTQDLQELSKDKHLGVFFMPGMGPPPPPTEMMDDAGKSAMKARVEQMGYGISRIMRLPGNIGYLEVVGFGPAEFIAPGYEAAVQLLAGSAAIIVDVRSNSGGEPDGVAQFMSHFFVKGDLRHLNDLYTRKTQVTREFWTNDSVTARYTGPVFVLTSSSTFSGGEEFAYDMQTQKRATLVGEITGGGANDGAMVPLTADFVAYIPDSKAINPITGTNWEGVGVAPDLAVTAAEALRAGYSAALQMARDNEQDPRRKSAYDRVIERAEAGNVQLPEWQPRGM